jgi:hypothetical protein
VRRSGYEIGLHPLEFSNIPNTMEANIYADSFEKDVVSAQQRNNRSNFVLTLCGALWLTLHQSEPRPERQVLSVYIR